MSTEVFEVEDSEQMNVCDVEAIRETIEDYMSKPGASCIRPLKNRSVFDLVIGSLSSSEQLVVFNYGTETHVLRLADGSVASIGLTGNSDEGGYFFGVSRFAPNADTVEVHAQTGTNGQPLSKVLEPVGLGTLLAACSDVEKEIQSRCNHDKWVYDRSIPNVFDGDETHIWRCSNCGLEAQTSGPFPPEKSGARVKEIKN